MTKIKVEAICEYQIFTDGNPNEIMDTFLSNGVSNGDLLSFVVDDVSPGRFGLGLVRFTVTVPMDEGTDWDEGKESVQALLCEIVGDSDVDVRWLSPLGRVK